MPTTEDPRPSLNSSQKLHLRTTCQYVDQLLAEAETILAASSSKSPFNKYKAGLSPVQIKVVQDYIARIRAQMVQVLKSQEISIPPPQFEARRSIRVNLEFADIAFEECLPYAMRGYGEVPESVIPELNGLVVEVKRVLRKLSTYLAQDLGQDLESRLQRLEHTGDEIGLLKTLERIINERGLVEFRSTLSVILDRLESDSFQIAVFGRVSSGKSSLLNHILETDVLPVGVNPITAIPTRIVHGAEPKLTVAYLDRKSERTEIARLPEFVSEQFNPGNTKHVTRIVTELPSRRLQDGVVSLGEPQQGRKCVHKDVCGMGMLLSPLRDQNRPLATGLQARRQGRHFAERTALGVSCVAVIGLLALGGAMLLTFEQGADVFRCGSMFSRPMLNKMRAELTCPPRAMPKQASNQDGRHGVVKHRSAYALADVHERGLDIGEAVIVRPLAPSEVDLDGAEDTRQEHGQHRGQRRTTPRIVHVFGERADRVEAQESEYGRGRGRAERPKVEGLAVIEGHGGEESAPFLGVKQVSNGQHAPMTVHITARRIWLARRVERMPRRLSEVKVAAHNTAPRLKERGGNNRCRATATYTMLMTGNRR